MKVTSFGNSDHDFISYVRFNKDPKDPSRTIRKRSYRKFEAEKFLADLNMIDWSYVYACREVDYAVQIFTYLYKGVLDNHAPWTLYQQRHKYTPWVSDDTIKLIKERDHAKNKVTELSRKGVDTSSAWADFKKLRNKINNKLKYEERNYKMQKFSNSLSSSSDCWKTAKEFMSWKYSGGPPRQLLDGGILVTKAATMATKMNEFFIKKVQDIRSGIPFLPSKFDKCYALMKDRKIGLELHHIPVYKVLKILKSMKSSKSTGIDTLDSYSLKIAADVVVYPLHHIICLSIMQSKFPSDWKFSKVIPLHKKGSKLEKQNYRPVAILSPLNKGLERVVYDQIYSYFHRNKIFNENLHGFRRNRSTHTALLTMYDRWTRAASMGQISGVVLMDLSCAFDLVDHQLLLKNCLYMD